jgi:TonB family protein
MSYLSKYYEILGLEPGASLKEVKQAYRDMVKVWHPDLFLHDPRLQQTAQEKLKEINVAYEELLSCWHDGGFTTLPPRPPKEPPSPYPTEETPTKPYHIESRFPAAAFVILWAMISFAGTVYSNVERLTNLGRPPSQATIIISDPTILKDGRLEEVRLIRSSGLNILDEEGIQAVKAASPFNPFPSNIANQKLFIDADFDLFSQRAVSR